MISGRQPVFKLLKSWFVSENGVAGIEGALVFPVMLVMLLGVYDMGNGILANQKTIRASQVAADLVTRHRSVDDTQINEAIEAARLAYEPVSSAGFGIDIISIRFDEDANGEIVWRETRNMTALSNPLTRVASLAEPNSGL
jgi:Flp pilus assembly protein TadG